MIKKVKSRKNWAGPIISFDDPFDLADLVNDYLTTEYYCKYSSKKETHAAGHICYLNALNGRIDFISGEPNFGRTTLPFKINGHQRFFRFPTRQAKIPNIVKEIETIEGLPYNNFEELYDAIENLNLYGFGETTTYDYALRYGWHLSPRLEPTELVYLHSKPMEAAVFLKDKGYIASKLRRTMPLSDFPDEITVSGMTTRDVEHFLCCYKKFIELLPIKK